MRNRTLPRLLIASVLLSSPAFAEVEPDCFEGAAAKTCNTSRLKDLRFANVVFGKTLRTAGWDDRSFGVQYRASSDGGPDTLLFTLRGPSSQPAKEADESPKAASAEEMALIAEGIRKQLDAEGGSLGKFLRFVDEVQIDNGQGLVHTALKVPCYEGFCSSYRKADAEDAERLLAPVLEKAGWRPSLFGVHYVAGADADRADSEAKDKLVIVLRGPRGGQRPTYEGASSEDAHFAVQAIETFLREAPPAEKERALRGVDTVHVDAAYFTASLPNPSAVRKRLSAEDVAKAREILSRPPLFGGGSSDSAAPEPAQPDEAKERASAQPAIEDCAIETSVPGVVRAVARHRNELRYCYETTFTGGTRPAGQATFTFVVDPDGHPQTPRVRGDVVLGDELFDCLLRRIRKWHFAATEGQTGPVSITCRFPLTVR
ncbi:MAG: AgmX/PglI C-terminal domain-containing protein [Myxococcales bacterium]|jgi:hypothetical protein